VLTLLVTIIFTPMTLIASIYGVNFEYLPGSRLESGFHIALGAMAITGLGMPAFFSRR
jgi:magnesium transporter